MYNIIEMYGLSDHDLMFSKEDEEVEGDENREYIEGRFVYIVECLQIVYASRVVTNCICK